MPKLIILRLHPTKPMKPAAFKTILQQLTIDASDISYEKPADGTLLGTASTLAPVPTLPKNDVANIRNTSILQHYEAINPGGGQTNVVLSAATAVIVVDNPPAREFPSEGSFDIRLKITVAGGRQVLHRRIDYNGVTSEVTGALSKDQRDYFVMAPTAFVGLPVSGGTIDPIAAFELPDDGLPPNFDELVKAIDRVLKRDPGAPADTLVTSKMLTPAQARLVAAELIWNRTTYPLPETDPSISLVPFSHLYTEPPVDAVVIVPLPGTPPFKPEDIKTGRQMFEASQTAYYSQHDADARQLARYVYAAAAAVECERLSRAATRARLDFPLIVAGKLTGRAAAVALKSTAPAALSPQFVVPAAFFFALGTQLPEQLDPHARFESSRVMPEDQLLLQLGAARDAGVIGDAAVPLTVAGGSAVDIVQVSRRLRAVGASQTLLPEVELTPGSAIGTIVENWLAHKKPTETIEDDFWVPEVASHAAGYLELVLAGITYGFQKLIDAIKAAPLSVTGVDKLVSITERQWTQLFLPAAVPPNTAALPKIELLPEFTKPGNPAERTAAFIRHLRTFFTVKSAMTSAGPAASEAPAVFDRSVDDVFDAFAAAYQSHAGSAFDFDTPADPGAITSAVADVFPGDSAAQTWMTAALTTIRELWDLTEDVGPDSIRFSLIEALYARGFTSSAQVSELSPADFQYAITGTVAYGFAAGIYSNATNTPPLPDQSAHQFNPVNPDGALTDCIPPEHLSPLGPVTYLRDLLRLSAASSCDDPFPAEQHTIASIVAGRRGPLSDLHASEANLSTPIPAIDLVNESLEHLVTAVANQQTVAGTVHNTAADTLHGHLLAGNDDGDDERWAHDPATLFSTVPEHSSPATPVAAPDTYRTLQSDFTNPAVPYPQALDVNRSYLTAVGTSRLSAMRHFRSDITELPTDATHEPSDFRRHQWRYPLRLELALEYLGISFGECQLLYSQDIADTVTPGRLVLHEVYGYPAAVVGKQQRWTEHVLAVPAFLARIGLDYCDFYALWRSEFVEFSRAHDGGGAQDAGGGQDPPVHSDFPECAPCCLDNLVIDFGQEPQAALRKLAVFVRLWRRLREHPWAAMSFTALADTARVLKLFDGDSVNPDFLRQLAAFVQLRELLCLPLTDPAAELGESAVDADRTHLLALWVGPTHARWAWAVATLVEGVEQVAECVRPELANQPELSKLMAANLNPLSVLAGFDPDTPTDTWHAKPTTTIRFAEVLLKIYLSEFTVGEVLYLYSNNHLDGDDPFPLPTVNESLDNPLELPDDDANGLWELRRKLLDIATDDTDGSDWSWARITAALTDEFGYRPGTDDPLLAIAEHFFPTVLEAEGATVTTGTRRFTAPLPVTTEAAAVAYAAMWNSPPNGPFRYDKAAQLLWTTLPMSDRDVAERLATLRQLTEPEHTAVRSLYFAPRTLLARFGLLFDNLDSAIAFLVEEPDEAERFSFVQHQFSRFHARCTIIDEHLAGHVRDAAPQDTSPVTAGEVARVLRSMFGDENRASTPWEASGDTPGDNSGSAPTVTWPNQPTGGGYAALLGLLGTGLLGQFTTDPTAAVWREIRGPLTAFGKHRNDTNAPAPTIIPSMTLALTSNQLQLVAIRNGFALRDEDGEPLGGAQPFSVTWTGDVLIEHSGRYEFAAGEPTPDGDEPGREHCEDHRWRITLSRGQKTWTVINRNWPGDNAPDWHSAPIDLRRGTYHLTVELQQPQPTFDEIEGVRPRHTGFQVKYVGADTDQTLITIPRNRLYRTHADTMLATKWPPASRDEKIPDQEYLAARYTSSLRDIRRTYQRAFKAALIAHRMRLSATPLTGEPQSEIGFLLDNAKGFAGQTHPRTVAGIFGTHRAWLDLNLLPVDDPYHPPNDQRATPSRPRQAALFDSWERLYDYTVLRHETRRSRQRPAWRLFLEASELQPDNPAQLVRHIGIDVRHAPLVTRYRIAAGDTDLVAADLETEIWAIRAWRGETWLDQLEACFRVAHIENARPSAWAADDPAADGETGNANLTRFVRDGAFDNEPPRRYRDVQHINDGLRVRARDALVAWLCGMNRVPIPDQPGSYATRAGDLSDLLLQDVETGTCARRSRIEDAILAVQTLVQLATLGRISALTVSPAFAQVWDDRLATFTQWRCHTERTLYRENWIQAEAVTRAQRVEAFQLLQSELERGRLSLAVPGGMEWWMRGPTPPHPSLPPLQSAEASRIRMLLPGASIDDEPTGPLPEGLDLLGTPDADGQPSWLAPLRRLTSGNGGNGDNGNGDNDGDGDGDGDGGAIHLHGLVVGDPFGAGIDSERLPLWIRTAVRLGVRFVRVAASGLPPAASDFRSCATEPTACCDECSDSHDPLVDEYYFWLQDTSTYAAVGQDADIGLDPDDETSNWHRADTLPQLLQWSPQPAVHLCWVRLHNGVIGSRRRSTAPLRTASASTAQLVFLGRHGDSLTFKVTGGQSEPGHTGTPAPGFRYDLADNTAHILPLLTDPPTNPTQYLGGLTSYPFFAYVCPGAPVEPTTTYAVAATMADYLAMHCQFTAAMRWLELATNPLTIDNGWTACARLPLPPVGGNGGEDHGGEIHDNGPIVDIDNDDAFVYGRGDTPCCPTTTTNSNRLHERAIMLRYSEITLDLVAKLRCTGTPEATGWAGVLLGQLARLAGTRPRVVSAADDETGTPISQFTPRPPRINPRLIALYDRIADEQGLLERCVNRRRLVDGTPGIDMSFFGDHIPGDSCCGCDDCCATCCDAYRFTARMPFVDKLIAVANEFAGKFAAAVEKGDAEYLASLRATYEQQLNQLTLQVRQLQYRDADWQVQALEKTRASAKERLRYQKNLLDTGLNAGEIGYENHLSSSKRNNTAGVVLTGIAGSMALVPDFTFGGAGFAGTPVAITQLPIGSKLNQFFSSSAQVVNGLAGIDSTDAGLNNQQSNWVRRADDWTEQTLQAIPIELEQIERQLLGAERRRDAALLDVNIAQQSLDNSSESLDFQLDKSTNHAFYLGLQQRTAALFYRAFELARCELLAMQRRWNFERGYATRRFVPSIAIHSLQDAVVAADRLKLAAAEMEKAYLDDNCRDYELTKIVSLRDSFPTAYLQLITRGATEIELPEWMFDHDYPGHYMRRVKNISLSIYGHVTPRAGVHCRLTLLSSRTRIDPRVKPAPESCCGATCNCQTETAMIDASCGCRCRTTTPDPCCRCTPAANTYLAGPDDPRIVRAYAATEAIATSSGQNDSGMFEVSFRDERYLPFEFAGATCRLRIEMPQETNFFDLRNDTNDLFAQVLFSSREGGPLLAAAALDAAQQHLPGDGVRLFELRRDLPDVWPAVRRTANHDHQAERWSRRFDLRLSRAMFPFVPNKQVTHVDQLQIFIQAACASPGANITVRFRPGDHTHGDHDCGCHHIDVTCVATSEYPGLFWGFVNLEQPLGPMDADEPSRLGTFELPDRVGEVCNLYLVARYCVQPKSACGPTECCRCSDGSHTEPFHTSSHTH